MADDDEDWIAVKPFKIEKPDPKKEKLVIIVSINEDEQKVN